MPDPAAAIRAAVQAGTVLALPDDQADEPELLALARYGDAEAAVAENCARLLATAEPLADRSAAEAVGAELDDRAARGGRARPGARGVDPHRRPRHREEPDGGRRRRAGRVPRPQRRPGRADRAGRQAAGRADRSRRR
ncbi:MAG: hypothetical protein WKF78_00385 [Candidatus Limnocylindrales bacterium]